MCYNINLERMECKLNLKSEASYKMDLGQVFTNENVAEYMVSLFNLNNTATILEPCFGAGAFLKACMNQGYNNVTGYELDETLYKEVQEKYPDFALHNQDFLCTNFEIKYDGIIMNPPYIRQEKIDDLHSYNITKDVLRQNHLFAKLPRTANMYMYFIFKAIDALKSKGELVVIFPSSWLQARSGRIFEKLLYSECTLKQQIHISGEVFEKDALVEVVILKLIKGKVAIESETKNLEILNGQFVDKVFCAVNGTIDFNMRFEKYARVRRGLTTGFNTMFINPVLKNESSKKALVPIISSPKSIDGYSTNTAETDILFAPTNDIRLNEEIMTYISFWENHILQTGTPKILFEKIRQGVSWYSIRPFDSRGILFSYFVRNDMKFIDNSLGTLARDNFYIIYPRIDHMLLFALLNNYYTYYQLEKVGKKYGAGLLKLQRYDLEDLKFLNIDTISENDKIRLSELAMRLSTDGDESLISEITEVIATYSDVNFKEITNQYNEIKRQRLEG